MKSSHLLLSLLSAALVQASDVYEQYKPKSAEKELNLNSSNAEQEKEVANNQEILSKLKGIVISDKPSSVNKKKDTSSILFDIKLNGVQRAAVKEQLSPYLGQKLTLADVNKLTKSLVEALAPDGELRNVIVPEQDVTNGVITMLVIESELSSISMVENDYFSEEFIRKSFSVQEGDVINITELNADLEWLGRNSFIQPAIELTAGDAFGSTSIKVDTNNELPLFAYLSYGNFGNEATGDNRWSLGATYGNAWGLGHRVSYQMSMADEFDQTNVHSFSYTAGLGRRQEVKFYGAYASSESSVSVFDSEGESMQAGVEYTHAHKISNDYASEFYAGFDWKKDTGSTLFGPVNVADNETQIGQFKAGYRGEKQGKQSVFTYDVKAVASSEELLSNQTEADYNSSRNGATSDYMYLAADVSYATIYQGVEVYSNFLAQLASKNLLASEQIGLGGFNSVRGYSEREIGQTDSGFVAQHDVKLYAQQYLKSDIKANFLWFVDYGYATAKDGDVLQSNGESKSSVFLASTGPSVVVGYKDYAQLKLEYGYQLKDVDSDEDNGKLHVSFNLVY